MVNEHGNDAYLVNTIIVMIDGDDKNDQNDDNDNWMVDAPCIIQIHNT